MPLLQPHPQEPSYDDVTATLGAPQAGIDHAPDPSGPDPVKKFVQDFVTPAAVAVEHILRHNLGELVEFRTGLNPAHDAADAEEAVAVDGGFDDRSDGEKALLKSVVDTGRFVLAGDGVQAPSSKPPRRRWTGLSEQPQANPTEVEPSIPGETDDTKSPQGDDEKTATSQPYDNRLLDVAWYDPNETLYDINLSAEDKERVVQADTWLKDNCTREATVVNDGNPWLGEEILIKVALKENAVLPGGDMDDVVLLRVRKTLGNLGKKCGDEYIKDNLNLQVDPDDDITYDTDPVLTGLVERGTFKAETGLFLMAGSESQAAVVEHNRGSFPGLRFDEASKNKLIAAGHVSVVLDHKKLFEAEGATVDTDFARHILDNGEPHEALVVIEHCAEFPDLHITNDDLRALIERADYYVGYAVLPQLHNMKDVNPDVKLMKAFCDGGNSSPQYSIQKCLETGLFKNVPVSVVRDILSASKQGLDEKEFGRILIENFTAFDPNEAGAAIAGHIDEYIDVRTSFTKLPAELQSDIFKRQLAKKSALYMEHYSELDATCLDALLRTGTLHKLILANREPQEVFIGVDSARLHDVAEILRMSGELYVGPDPEQTQKEYIRKFLSLSPDADQDAIYASVDIWLMGEFAGLGQASLDRVVNLLARGQQNGVVRPEFFSKLDPASQELVGYISGNMEDNGYLQTILQAYMVAEARNQPEYKSNSMTERLHMLQNLARNGLFDVAGPATNEYGWSNTNMRELIGIILRSPHPEDSLGEIQQLVGEGVLLFGGQSNLWLQNYILRSNRRVSLFHEFQQLEAQGLFELGGRDYNAWVLHFISSSENVTERFATIASCIEHGLFDVGNETNRREIVNYVLQSEDPRGTMAVVRELSDRRLFSLEHPSSQMIMKRVMGSKDPLAEYSVIEELVTDGLFTLGGTNNADILQYLLQSTDMKSAFKTLRQLVDTGLIELHREMGGALQYVLGSSEPVATFEKAKLIRDKTDFLRRARRQYKKEDGTLTEEFSLNIAFYPHADQWLKTLSAIPDGEPGNAIRAKMLDRLFLPHRMANLLDGAFEYWEAPVQAIRLFTELVPTSQEKIREKVGALELELMRLLVVADTSLETTDTAGIITGFRGFPSARLDKLKQVFIEEDAAKLYAELYAAKMRGPDQLTQFLKDHPLLTERPRGDRKTLPAALEKVRSLNEYYRREPAVAAAWFNQYATEPIKVTNLLAAWESRADALTYRDPDNRQYRVADNPNSIRNFVAEHGIRLYAERRIESNTTDLTAAELSDSKEWISSIGSRYSAEDSFLALERVARFKREHAGSFPPKFIAPEKTTVSYEKTVLKRDNQGNEEEGKHTRVMEAEVLAAGDPRGFTIGYDTGCCMTLGGASETCIWSGLEDSRYAFFAVYDVYERLRAQSIMYLAEQDGKKYLVLDNIEANAGTDLSVVADVYKNALTKFIEHQQLDIDAIHIGEGYVKSGILDNLPVAVVNPQTPRAGTYTDARSQRVLWAKE